MIMWYEQVCAMTAEAATAEIRALSPQFVASFWRWNDSSTADYLEEATGEKFSALVEELRAVLLSDVLAEISDRAGV